MTTTDSSVGGEGISWRKNMKETETESEETMTCTHYGKRKPESCR